MEILLGTSNPSKAAWYGQFHPYVISADSALYIKELPLDSISIRRKTGAYFVESREEQMTAAEEVLAKAYKADLLAFYAASLGLKRR